MANNYDALNQSRKELVESITGLMQKEGLNWTAGWSSIARPYNPVSDVRYRGGNVLRLLVASQINKYTDPRWLTYKQAQEKGWQVKKGSRGVKLEKWIFEKEETVKDSITGEEKKIKVGLDKPIPYSFTVFNASQIDGIPELETKEPLPRDEMFKLAADVVGSSECHVENTSSGNCYYVPAKDTLYLPPADDFYSNEGYLATALHEMAHSTGHSSRLNRNILNSFGTAEYAKEELIAELTSAFTQQQLGLDLTANIENHAAYLQSWIKAINDDPNELFRAAAAADKASDRLVHNYELYIEKELNVEKAASPAQEELISDEKVELSNFEYEEGYLHFTAQTDGYLLKGLFRIYDPNNGPDMTLVSVGYDYLYPVIKEHWESIEQQLKEKTQTLYTELKIPDETFYREAETTFKNRWLPDQSVTVEDMNKYGYISEEMLPLKKEKALALYDAGVPIHILYTDNTEVFAEDRMVIEQFGGLMGVEKESFQPYLDLQSMRDSEDLPFPPLIDGDENIFAIYQINNSENGLKYRFEPMNFVQSNGIKISDTDYELMYKAPLDGMDLEQIYEKFNMNHPSNYMGRPLSVSDIIVIRKDGQTTCNYIDSIGFKDIPVNEFYRGYFPEKTVLPEINFSAPVVTINYSENAKLYSGQKLELAEAEALFAHLDEEKIIWREQPGYDGTLYDKTSFKIDFVFNGESQTYEGRQDFGDGDGSLINHIKLATENLRNDSATAAFILEHEGAEVLERKKAAWKQIVDELVPYFKMHCSLYGIEKNAKEALELVSTQPEKDYYNALLSYVTESRLQLNTGNIGKMPQMPDRESFINEKTIAKYIKASGYRPTKKLAACVDTISKCTGTLSISVEDLKKTVKKNPDNATVKKAAEGAIKELNRQDQLKAAKQPVKTPAPQA